MRVLWESSDIVCGRRVRKPGTGASNILGFLVTNAGNIYGMTALSDGMFIQFGDLLQVASALNEGCYVPEELLTNGKWP